MIIGDLFAGVGGMSQGFRMAGDFSVAFAVEFDKDIAKSYQMNHKKKLNHVHYFRLYQQLIYNYYFYLQTF